MCLVGGGKVEGWKNMSLYKFTYMPLLKNYAQSKQKSVEQPKKKTQSPKFIKK